MYGQDMMRTFRRTTYSLVLAFLPIVASSAEVELVHLRYDPDYPNVVTELSMTLTGPIEMGDAEKVRAALNSGEAHLQTDATGHAQVTLDSQGGSFEEAIRLMDLFREVGISTRIEADAECFSACAIAFMGGHHVNKASILWPHRTVDPGGSLGFHAPSLENVGEGMVPVEVLSISYEVALEAIAAIIERKEEFQIADSLIEIILGTPPSGMYIVETIDDFKRWRIGTNVEETPNWRPNQQEMARLCRNVFSWENGASPIVTEWEGSGPLPDELLYETRVAEITGRFAPVPWPSSSDSFMAAQTFEYEWNEFCVVHDDEFRGNHSVFVYETSSDPASFVATLAGSNAPRKRVSSSDALHPQTKLATLKAGPPIFDFAAPQLPPTFSTLDAIATPSFGQFRQSNAGNALAADRLVSLWSKWGVPEELFSGTMAATCPFKDGDARIFCLLIGCQQPSGPIGVNVLSFGMLLPSRLDLSIIAQNGYRIDFPLELVPDIPLLHHEQPHRNTVDVLLRFLKQDQRATLNYTTNTGEKSHLMVLSGSSRALSRIEQVCARG